MIMRFTDLRNNCEIRLQLENPLFRNMFVKVNRFTFDKKYILIYDAFNVECPPSLYEANLTWEN